MTKVDSHSGRTGAAEQVLSPIQHRLPLAFLIGGPVASALVAAWVLGTAPRLGYQDPQDAYRLLLRGTGLVSAFLLVGTFVAARSGDVLLIRAGYRGVLGSQLVHLIGLILGKYLWSPARMGTVTSQRHALFAMLPDAVPIVLGSLGYVVVALLAVRLERLRPRARIACEASVWAIFAIIYTDLLVSHAGEAPARTVYYGSIVSALTLAGAARVMRVP